MTDTDGNINAYNHNKTCPAYIQDKDLIQDNVLCSLTGKKPGLSSPCEGNYKSCPQLDVYENGSEAQQEIVARIRRNGGDIESQRSFESRQRAEKISAQFREIKLKRKRFKIK